MGSRVGPAVTPGGKKRASSLNSLVVPSKLIQTSLPGRLRRNVEPQIRRHSRFPSAGRLGNSMIDPGMKVACMGPLRR